MKYKNKKSALIVFIVLAVIILGFFGTLYYISSTINNYSYEEKDWINANTNNKIDIYVEPNLPVFSDNGKGVYYDYLHALSEDSTLTFNVVTTDTAKVKLTNKNTLEDEDILFYRDHFVVLGEINTVNKLEDLLNKKVGIISSDKENVSYYLTEYKDIEIVEYTTFEDLDAAYEAKTINYIVLPMYKYLDQIINNKYEIIFHLDGLYSYFCLDTDEENVNLDGIMTKFYNKWKKESIKKKNQYFLNIYYDNMSYTELQKESITNEDLIVGYIDNLPYEGMINNDFTGLTSTYLAKFADMTGVTYKYIEYKDTKDLTSALNNKKIDLALNYYSLSNEKYDSSRTLGNTKYVVLAHVDNNIVVNSLYSLAGTHVDMLTNMNLKYNMASKNLFEINDFANVDIMLKNINEESIIIIEKEVFDYYKDSGLKDFSIRYIADVKLNNSFLLNKSNEAFNKLFDFYLSTISSNEIKNESVEGVIETLKNNKILNFILTNIVYIAIIILVIIFIIYGITRKLMHDKKIKKEDRLYYFDAMTNLKNRNYLNDNIDFWSSTKVYPQAVIVIDINKLKALNDRAGHEAGDSQIKAVASILIKTQRDNSEIMRTDGDEFMIYLVGYDEKKIGTYIHKLNRELVSALPNKDYGVSIGYSMILNEQTTIDDAINDSLNMINKTKGK